VLRLHGGRRLHFDEDEAFRRTHEDVDRGEDLVGDEGGLEEDLRARGDRFAGLRDAVSGAADENASGEESACELAYAVALIEERLVGVRGHELRSKRLVGAPPQEA